jgi:hypothetical protein
LFVVVVVIAVVDRNMQRPDGNTKLAWEYVTIRSKVGTVLETLEM